MNLFVLLATLFFGMALSPLAKMFLEWWLYRRPRKMTQPGYYDHCRGCGVAPS